MTDEQIKEFISLKPQFVKYIYTCLKGATFFHPNDLINEAFIELSKQKNPIKDVRLSGLFFIKRRLINELRRSNYRPLLKEVFKSNNDEKLLNDKAEEDNYEGNTLIHSTYDFNKITQILNSYPNQQIKNFTWLKYQGFNEKELSEIRKKIDPDNNKSAWQLRKLKLYISENLDLDYHKIEKAKIKKTNLEKKIKKRNNQIKIINSVIVRTIKVKHVSQKEIKPIIVNTFSTQKRNYTKSIKNVIYELKSKKLSNKQIKEKLNISMHTVDKYVRLWRIDNKITEHPVKLWNQQKQLN